jgi:hypothetical protein
MSKFREHLLSMHTGSAFLIEDQDREIKTKGDYITNAEVGLIVAFRLNFEAKSKVKLTKVISGQIVENNKEDEMYVVETKNKLKYGVPYSSVVWVKTGGRWPKGVYDEMKKGSVVVEDVAIEELGELE